MAQNQTEPTDSAACSTAFSCGAKWGTIYGRIEILRSIVSGMLSEPMPGVDASIKDSLQRLRTQVNGCLSLVLEASSRQSREHGQ